MGRAWYAYTNTGSDPLLASSYRLVTTMPACRNGIEICAIYAYFIGDVLPAIGSSPRSPLTTNIQLYITNGLVSFSAQPDTDGGAFVYLKSVVS